MRRCTALAGAVAITLLARAPAHAQEGSLSFDFGASYALPPGGGFGDATEYLNGGLRLSGLFSSVAYGHIGGYAGLSLRESGSSWGALVAGGGVLAPVSTSVSLGFALTGEAFTVGAPFPYRAATVRLEPEVVVTEGRTTLRVRGYGGLGTSEVTVTREFVRDTRFGPVTFEVGLDVQSNLWTWGGGLELRHLAGRVVPKILVEAYDAPQGGYVSGRVGLEARWDRWTLTAEGGVWDTPDGAEGVVVVGFEVPIGGGGGLLAGGGRLGPDPLLDTPIAGSAAANVSVRLARLGPGPESSNEIFIRGDTLVARFELRAPDASAVSVAGDLTEWVEVPLVRAGDGWVVELPVEPGAHHYGFLVDGAWYVPADAPGRTEDEWGGIHATLIVPDSGTRTVEPEM